MHGFIGCGVNRTPGAYPLSYAEKDADDIYTEFTGPFGAAEPEGANLLLGAWATCSSVRRAFHAMRQKYPDYFVFYFSGHGDENGICLADNLLHFQEIIRLIRSIEASYTLVVLDACSAASYLDYTKKQVVVGGWGPAAEASWLDLVAKATPGCRLMFSTGRNRTAAEGGGTANGHFTDALLQVIRRGRGDLRRGRHDWISDQAAFDLTRQIMFGRHGHEQIPVARNLTGDFPMMPSQVRVVLRSQNR